MKKITLLIVSFVFLGISGMPFMAQATTCTASDGSTYFQPTGYTCPSASQPPVNIPAGTCSATTDGSIINSQTGQKTTASNCTYTTTPTGQILDSSGKSVNPNAIPPPTSTSFAQNCTSCSLNYTPLEPLPYGGEGTNISLGQYLFAAFKVLIVAGGLMAVLAFVIAGISYMVSDVVNQKEWARARMQSAVWGLILLLASWLILDTINPQLLTFSALSAPPASGQNNIDTSAGNVIAPANTSSNPNAYTMANTPGYIAP